MHPALRKRHRIVWLLFAIVLPVLFIIAICNIPEKATQEKLFQKIENPNNN